MNGLDAMKSPAQNFIYAQLDVQTPGRDAWGNFDQVETDPLFLSCARGTMSRKSRQVSVTGTHAGLGVGRTGGPRWREAWACPPSRRLTEFEKVNTRAPLHRRTHA